MFPLLLVAALTLTSAPPASRTVWVDVTGVAGADGSRERPYGSLQEALREIGRGGGVIALSRGTHQAGVTLPPGCTLRGTQGTIVKASAAAFVLRAPQGVTLQRLTIEGGERGLEASGQVVTEDVSWEGFAEAAIALEGGELTVRRATFRSATTALRAIGAKDAKLTLEAVSFVGPLKRAIEIKDSSLRVAGLHSNGPATAVHQIAGELHLEDADIRGGAESAIALARVSGALRNIRVEGHEYALLIRESERIDGRDLYSARATRAAFAFIQTQARLEGVFAISPGVFGGVQIVGGDISLTDFWIHRAQEQAFSARNATVALSDGRITDVLAGSDEGHAIQLRAAKGTLRRISVWKAAGVGVWSAESAQLGASDVRVVEADVAGFAVETHGQLKAARISVLRSKASALVASDHAVVEIEQLTSNDNEGGAGAIDCASGPTLTLGGLVGTGNLGGLDVPCVTRR